MPKYMLLFGFLQASGATGLLWFLALPHATMVYNMGLMLVFILSSIAFGVWGYFAGYERAKEEGLVKQEQSFLAYLDKENGSRDY